VKTELFKIPTVTFVAVALIVSIGVSLIALPINTVSAASATVTVDASNVIVPTIDKRLYGVYSAAWDELIYRKGVIDANYLQTVKDSKVTLLRYPGGAWGNDFVWNSPSISSMMTTDQFIAFCQQVGAEPTITISLNQPVSLATAWVKYCNIDHNYNVKYWEMHDEPWYDQIKGTKYASLINQFAPAMKAIDPTIKIVACVSCRYGSERSFTDAAVKGAWQNIDVYSHNAFFIDPGSYSYANRYAYYQDLLHNTIAPPTYYNSIHTWLSDLRTIVNKYKSPSKPVEYAVGSYNSISYYPADWQINYLPEGLWVAEFLGALIQEQTNNLKWAALWHMQNPYPPKQASYGYVAPDFRPYVSYYGIQLYTYHFGTTLVSSNSNSNDLVVYASKDTTKDMLYLILVNRTPSTNITTTFNLQNWSPKSTARAWILDGPTEPDNLPGRVLGYGIRVQDITGVGSTFTWTVPAFSAVAMEIAGPSGTLSSAVPPPKGIQRSPEHYTPVGSPNNLALGKPATASSVALSTEPIDYHIDAFQTWMATDGNDTYTRWAAKIWWETTDYPVRTEWFTLDLGAVTNFNRIIIKWGLWASTYKISVSNDGATWTQVASNTNAVRTKNPPSPWDQIGLTSQNAQYIKLDMTALPRSYPFGQEGMATNAFAIWEFEVYKV